MFTNTVDKQKDRVISVQSTGGLDVTFDTFTYDGDLDPSVHSQLDYGCCRCPIICRADNELFNNTGYSKSVCNCLTNCLLCCPIVSWKLITCKCLNTSYVNKMKAYKKHITILVNGILTELSIAVNVDYVEKKDDKKDTPQSNVDPSKDGKENDKEKLIPDNINDICNFVAYTSSSISKPLPLGKFCDDVYVYNTLISKIVDQCEKSIHKTIDAKIEEHRKNNILFCCNLHKLKDLYELRNNIASKNNLTEVIKNIFEDLITWNIVESRLEKIEFYQVLDNHAHFTTVTKRNWLNSFEAYIKYIKYQKLDDVPPDIKSNIDSKRVEIDKYISKLNEEDFKDIDALYECLVKVSNNFSGLNINNSYIDKAAAIYIMENNLLKINEASMVNMLIGNIRFNLHDERKSMVNMLLRKSNLTNKIMVNRQICASTCKIFTTMVKLIFVLSSITLLVYGILTK